VREPALAHASASHPPIPSHPPPYSGEGRGEGRPCESSRSRTLPRANPQSQVTLPRTRGRAGERAGLARARVREALRELALAHSSESQPPIPSHPPPYSGEGRGEGRPCESSRSRTLARANTRAPVAPPRTARR